MYASLFPPARQSVPGHTPEVAAATRAVAVVASCTLALAIALILYGMLNHHVSLFTRCSPDNLQRQVTPELLPHGIV